MELYQHQTVTSCLLDEEAEIQARLAAPPVQPEREPAPGLQSLLEKTQTEYMKKTNGGVPGIRTMNRPSRRGGERGTNE